MELMELLEGRRSYRRFEQRKIPEEVLEEILKAARLSSSAANRQPLSYVAILSPEKVDAVFEYTRWAAYLPLEEGRPKKDERPVLFIAVIENLDISRDCDTDAGLAIANMTLAAYNRGVGSCIIGACDRRALSEMFSLTQNQKIHSVVAFGYPSHKSRIADMEAPEREGAVRYFLDENRDYVVPKRKISDIVRYL